MKKLKNGFYRVKGDGMNAMLVVADDTVLYGTFAMKHPIEVFKPEFVEKIYANIIGECDHYGHLLQK